MASLPINCTIAHLSNDDDEVAQTPHARHVPLYKGLPLARCMTGSTHERELSTGLAAKLLTA
jgi:hypothetical protein